MKQSKKEKKRKNFFLKKRERLRRVTTPPRVNEIYSLLHYHFITRIEFHSVLEMDVYFPDHSSVANAHP